MVFSRVSLLAAAVLAVASAADASYVSFGQFSYSVSLDSQSDSSGGFVSLPTASNTPYALVPPSADVNNFFSVYAAQQLNDYSPDEYILVGGTTSLLTYSGLGQTMSGQQSFQLYFTVGADAHLTYTLSLYNAVVLGDPEYSINGSYSLDKISSGGDPFALSGTLLGSTVGGTDLQADFPAGDYLLSITLNSAITGDSGSLGSPNLMLSGFAFSIPEPAAVVMFAMGGLLLTGRRWRVVRRTGSVG